MKIERSFSTLPSETVPVYRFRKRYLNGLLWKMMVGIWKGRKLNTTLATGEPFVLRIGDQLSQIIYTQGCHEPELSSRLLPFIKPGMTVFDIGANIGYFTVVIGRRVGPSGSVHAFEINENVLDLLEDNVRVAGLNNVLITRKAVTRSSGEAHFFIPQMGDEAEGSLQQSTRYDAAKTVKVQTVSVDDYVHEHEIQKVDLIKIDIEGGEYGAFEGASKLLASSRGKPVIMFEALDTACGNFGVTWLDVVELVKGFGYQIHQGDTANFFATPL